MKNIIEKNVIKSNTFLALLAIAILTTTLTKTATAKSLYVIADILGASESNIQPVQAYDIGVDGTLTFQAQHDIPHSMLGAVGMAIDSDSGYLFITYEADNVIQLLDPIRMTDAGRVRAPDAMDLAGIKYDHDKGLLYTADRRTNTLYVYNWFPETKTLTHVPGSPFRLQNATAYGIALDEIDDLLYVANATNTVTVYRTSDWRLVKSITLSRIAISIAVDVRNGFIYTGAGYAGNMFLTQYHLATGTEKEVQVEPDAGVMGLRVDTDTGLVYMSTGRDTVSGGDNLLVYDKALNQIGIIAAIGNPTDLAIPGRDIGYNPLNLKKQVLRGATAGAGTDEIKTVIPGDTYTYGIYFDNHNNYKVTDLTIVDRLPKEVTFVTANDDGVNGFYNYDEKTKTQTYTWTYKELPPGTSTLLEITVQMKKEVETGKIITNSVTINTNETPPTTTSVDVMTTNNALNLKKSILGSIEGQVTQVDSNDTIIYMIDFDNKGNEFEVTNVSVVDELPKEVTFKSAMDETGKAIGKYDEKTHTYTWLFDSLAPGSAIHLELEVTVNPDLLLGTIITNIVTVDCTEAPPSSSSVDAVVSYKPLNITKKAINSSGSEIKWIEPGENFIYKICFDSNNNDSEVTDVFLDDILPPEVTFISDQVDNKNFIGYYDLKQHSYTGILKSMEPGSVTCLEIEVNVKQDTPLNTIISNSVKIESNETLPSIADVNIVTGEPLLEVDSLRITPNELRRNGTSPRIKAVVQLPQGVHKGDINPDDRPKLYYQNRNTGAFVEIGSSVTSSYPTGTNNRPTITVYFSRPQLMRKAQYYGRVNLKIEGKLNTGQSYIGYAAIHITKFAGD
ncbi:MAG: hypothetical protein A2Z38_03160 [Planctomycetes bacterium RBG_19FT_COMBO_48_8]|nr:MAG: hypothetical protein A2Z38_03160 [Planctomycetes bacterium RBG_19FT_COMBO_48_8]